MLDCSYYPHNLIEHLPLRITNTRLFESTNQLPLSSDKLEKLGKRQRNLGLKLCLDKREQEKEIHQSQKIARQGTHDTWLTREPTMVNCCCIG